ncbi:RNA polymerase sigma-70 factor, ECF subfamily [Amycolatopsis mediterranei S699]|uniref:RNA polymerase sigma-70 factor, ECF subfamily n=3 Tax=Amycolatopsis mediterranei TaxID=33910 RepID=A0A0H3DG70_AMYMU|nr:RNA polymerase sigma-70 factor, ECF subfamily [Amycolatopsis mediterranei U32]AEK46855.1 RNA polymerase sigma-70 factor, ECF subfamily protein [Amycolatopsis mediterranei S699]AGT88702.1 RNA polymerase sigma-70 factor, ECF subfamily [Amycolatopsis mediterranei RB]KDO07885.1 RNA polymerase sigma70 factor [Amycolatopsis mediterranei]AFO81573.1 RNA polymerase sigma-70 factor, ECF subfamily [Amycolatopsis mediterranei S699]
MAVASKIATFDGRAQFTVWLRAVANNSALMTYRRLRAHAQRVQYPASLPDRADPRRTSVIAGTRIALLDAIEQLQVEDPDAAQPFLLREIGGLTYQEIVDYLGISLVNVKARIHRARKRIRAQLGDLRAG